MENNEIGTSRVVRQLFRYMDSDGEIALNEFCSDVLDREYVEYTDPELAIMSIDSSIPNENLDVFVNYSGYNFRNINNAARGRWNYEENGHIDEKAKYEELVHEMKTAINNNQASIGNVKTFRGVTIDYFRDYGISSLDELDALEGGFLLDKGFVSTSLVEDKCFYKQENDLGLDYNVKIKYLIPEEFGDGVCLSKFSYAPNQCEYLINTWNLAKVVDVTKEEDGAVLTAVMIPKKVYDKSYAYDAGAVK